MSESKSPQDNDTEGIDELAALRAQHAIAASSSMESVTRARERLDEESKPVSYTHLTLPTIYSV